MKRNLLCMALAVALTICNVPVFSEGEFDPFDASYTDKLNWPYDPTWPQNVTKNRGLVPEQVLQEPVYETGIDSIVTRTYPNGRLKAFLFAFDDGGNTFGTPSDAYMVKILNRYDLKGTFYLYMKSSDPTSGAGVYANYGGYPATWQGYKDGMKAFYEGHEVQSHGLTERSLDLRSFPEYKAELAQSQRRFEEATGKEVGGLAYHWVDEREDHRDGTTQEEKDEYLRSIGFRYSRRSIKDKSKVNYEVPLSFFNWEYDHRIIDDSDRNVDTILPNYFSMDPQNKMKVMVYFAHGWQVGPEWDMNSNKIRIRENYETMCRMLQEQRHQIWNVGTLEFVDYVNASRQLDIRFVGTGDVSVYNPSQVITCWVKAAGQQIAVQPGQTVIIPNPINIEYQPSGVVASFTDQAQLEGNVLSEIGTSTVVTDHAHVSQNPSGQLQMVQTVTSRDSDYIGLSEPWLIHPSAVTMIDVKYKVKADAYSQNTPLTAMTFSMPTVGVVGKAKLSTRAVQPSADNEARYNTLRIAIDNNAKTVYYSDNGGAFQAHTYPYEISYLRHLRLYPVAYPPEGEATENSTPLATPVTWTIDSIRVYQPSRQDLLKISSMKVKHVAGDLEYGLEANEVEGALEYAVSVRNYGLQKEDFTILAALYQVKDGVAVLEDISTHEAKAVEPMFFDGHSGVFDVSGITGDYFVKAFVWDDLDNLVPYDCLIRTKAQIEAN